MFPNFYSIQVTTNTSFIGLLGSVAPKEATNVMNDQPDKDVPDDVPDYVPDYLPDYVPDYVPDYMPDYMPDYVPDDVPVDEGLHRVADLVRRDDTKGKEIGIAPVYGVI